MKPITVLTCLLIAGTWHTGLAIGEGVLDLNAIMGIFSGMANLFLDVNTTDINIDRLMGKWHQMYKAAINFDVFQTNLYCEVAYFRRNKVLGRDGFSIEEAFHVIAKNGPIEVYKRDVTKTGTGEFWMYTEEYFYPRQFYIVKVGPEDGNENSTAPYEYLIATDSNRLALMVYARDPALFHQYFDKELQGFLGKQGFGGYVFWNQPVAIYQGSDCYYPSEQEVFTRRAVKSSQQSKYPSPEAKQAAAALAAQQQPQSSLINSPLQQQSSSGQERASLFNARQQALLNAQQQAAIQTQSGLFQGGRQQSTLLSGPQQQTGLLLPVDQQQSSIQSLLAPQQQFGLPGPQQQFGLPGAQQQFGLPGGQQQFALPGVLQQPQLPVGLNLTPQQKSALLAAQQQRLIRPVGSSEQQVPSVQAFGSAFQQSPSFNSLSFGSGQRKTQ